MPSGYSGTPLAKKLGVVDGQKTWRVGMPDSVSADIAASGSHPALFSHPVPDLQMVHIFVTLRCELVSRLAEAKQFLAPHGMIWISWPKKSSGEPTDISDETVRAEAFPLGLVDVKVCAVNEIWSGLKLVIRKMNRL